MLIETLFILGKQHFFLSHAVFYTVEGILQGLFTWCIEVAAVFVCRCSTCLPTCCGKKRFPPIKCLHLLTAEVSPQLLSVYKQAPHSDRMMPATAALRDLRDSDLVVCTTEMSCYLRAVSANS